MLNNTAVHHTQLDSLELDRAVTEQQTASIQRPQQGGMG